MELTFSEQHFQGNYVNEHSAQNRVQRNINGRSADPLFLDYENANPLNIPAVSNVQAQYNKDCYTVM